MFGIGPIKLLLSFLGVLLLPIFSAPFVITLISVKLIPKLLTGIYVTFPVPLSSICSGTHSPFAFILFKISSNNCLYFLCFSSIVLTLNDITVSFSLHTPNFLSSFSLAFKSTFKTYVGASIKCPFSSFTVYIASKLLSSFYPLEFMLLTAFDKAYKLGKFVQSITTFNSKLFSGCACM